MNNEQQQIIDEAYQNYRKVEFERIMSQNHGEYLMGKGEFINKCKTDNEFSEKWGLKIEERELSLLERREIDKTKLEWKDWVDVIKLAHYKETYDKYNIPTKLITVTYNDKIIESYE